MKSLFPTQAGSFGRHLLGPTSLGTSRKCGGHLAAPKSGPADNAGPIARQVPLRHCTLSDICARPLFYWSPSGLFTRLCIHVRLQVEFCPSHLGLPVRRPRVWFLLVRVDAAIDDAAGMASLVQEVWPSLVQVSKAREDRLENYLAQAPFSHQALTEREVQCLKTIQEAHGIRGRALVVDVSQTTQFARWGVDVSPTWSKGSKMAYLKVSGPTGPTFTAKVLGPLQGLASRLRNLVSTSMIQQCQA